MYYHRNLRVRLQELRNRLHRARYETYQNQLQQLPTFIDETPYLRGLIQRLDTQYPDTDWREYRTTYETHRGFGLPPDAGESAKIVYGVLRDCVTRQRGALDFANIISHERNFNDMLHQLTELCVEPLVNYLHDQIDDGNNVLYIPEKYKRRTEWFGREALLTAVEEDSGRSESTVDAHLRTYLFDQGIDNALVTPSSPSGRADVVADLGEEQPLVMEIKLFDPVRDYDRSYIRQGFRQIYDYAEDFSQSAGYLVIFNLTTQQLVFNLETAPQQGTPKIEIDHRTFFLVVINLATPDESASKRGKLKPYVIDEQYLKAI